MLYHHRPVEEEQEPPQLDPQPPSQSLTSQSQKNPHRNLQEAFRQSVDQLDAFPRREAPVPADSPIRKEETHIPVPDTEDHSLFAVERMFYVFLAKRG